MHHTIFSFNVEPYRLASSYMRLYGAGIAVPIHPRDLAFVAAHVIGYGV